MKLFRMATHSLRMIGRYKMRTGFMMMGSLIGIASLTFVISAGQAAQRGVHTMVSQTFGGSGILILAGGGESEGPRGTATRLKIDDIAAIAKGVPGIQEWDPVQVLATSARHGDSSDNVQVLGESERWPQVWNRTATRGDLFDETAVSSSARVAIIGETVAKTLFGNDDPIGADIQIGSVPFKVIGILETWGTNAHGMDRDNEIVVPISTLMRRLSNTDTISQAKLTVTDQDHFEEMKTQMRTSLRERHGIPSGQPDAFVIITPMQTRRMIQGVERVMFLYIPLVAGITLLVGGIVSIALMLSAVNERVAEIGLRRALGARAADIRLQFLLETTITMLVGGLGGIALGYTLAELGAIQMHLGSVNPLMAALLGFCVSTAVGLLAGVLPAIRAARLHPADALR